MRVIPFHFIKAPFFNLFLMESLDRVNMISKECVAYVLIIIIAYGWFSIILSVQ